VCEWTRREVSASATLSVSSIVSIAELSSIQRDTMSQCVSVSV
jgi:hypothetical protein